MKLEPKDKFHIETCKKRFKLYITDFHHFTPTMSSATTSSGFLNRNDLEYLKKLIEDRLNETA